MGWFNNLMIASNRQTLCGTKCFLELAGEFIDLHRNIPVKNKLITKWGEAIRNQVNVSRKKQILLLVT
jgi:hypothetical protein